MWSVRLHDVILVSVITSAKQYGNVIIADWRLGWGELPVLR